MRCHYLKPGRYLWHSLRRFSDDPAKTFRIKGLSEENRYFLKKQEEELRKLRKQFQLLSKYQEKLEKKLDETHKALEDVGKNIKN